MSHVVHDDDQDNGNNNFPNDDEDEDDLEVQQHPSYEQVMLDVNRCAGRLEHMKRIYFHRTFDDDELPEDLTYELENVFDDSDQKSTNESEENKDVNQSDYNCDNKEDISIKASLIENLHNQRKLKKNLAKLIVKLLIKKPDLHYYQGFHDVCLTYLTLYGDREAYVKLDKMIDTHFKTFMQPTMDETQEFLALIPTIIGCHDNKVQKFLDQAEVGTIFALSWVITWFSHVVVDERDVEKIFRFLEQHDPHMVLYLCAEIVIFKRDMLLELDPEMSTVHQFLSLIPRKEKLPVEKLLLRARDAFSTWCPDLVIKRLEDQRKRLLMRNYNLFNIASRLGPLLPNFVTTNTKTIIVVILVASALAIRFDHWTK